MSELKNKKSKIQINFFNADFLKCSKPKVFPKPHQHTSNSKIQKHQSKHSPLTSTSLYSIEKETKNETTTLLEEDKEKIIQKLNCRISELEFRIKRLENNTPSNNQVLSSSSSSNKKVLSNSNSTKDKNNIILKKQMKSSLTNIIKAKRTFSNIKIIDNNNNNNNALSLSKNRNRSYTHSNNTPKLKQFQTLSVKVSSSNLKRNEQYQMKHNWKSQINRSIDSNNIKSIPKIPKRNINYSSYTTANYSPINKKEMLTINNSTIYEEGDVLKLKFDLIKIRTKNLLERFMNDKQCNKSNVSSLSNVTPFEGIRKGGFSRNKTFH